MRRPETLRFAGLLGIVILAGMLSACSGAQYDPGEGATTSAHATAPRSHTPPARSPNDVNDAAAIEKSYMDAIAVLQTSFPLPQGDSYPVAAELTWDPTVHVEADMGALNANYYWRCSWSNQYFEAAESNNVREENRALDMLEKWPSTPYFIAHVQDGEPGWVKAAIDPARAGDDNVLRSVSGSDCAFFYNNNAPHAG